MNFVFSKTTLLALCLLAACESDSGSTIPSVPRDALRTELLSCYALYTEDGHLLDSTFYNASPLVRLDSVPLGISATDTFPGIFRRLIRLGPAGERIDPSGSDLLRAWWADSLTDSIRVSFSDGFSGAQVVLAAGAGRLDTLRGRIEEHWDVGPTVTDRGKVYAVRRGCVKGAA